MSKLLTVFGATGNQGGSVIDAVLANPVLSKEFTIRGITRDASKAAAKDLASKGVEIVTADLASAESVAAAVAGSHTIFLVTSPNFANPAASPERIHGKIVADAAVASNVKHLIYSSLLHVTKETGGRLSHVVHFDQKADVEEYIRSKPIRSTFVLPGYFMSNFSQMMQKGPDGAFTLAYPVSADAQFPLFDAKGDTGKFVAAVLSDPETTYGQQVLAASGYYTPKRILSEFEEVTGQKANFYAIDADTYKSYLPPSMAQEMLENHLFVEDPGYFKGLSLDASEKLLADAGTPATSWKEFLEKNQADFQ
ncbi:NmrA family transcriptional regulator [Plectosphaerella plurivora]|uniref:NmrA family transcriptional regulator n=1 Tax=Plectosphaerella plurivora TaxID=936078 RepID=A0A9P9A8S4_9PEZI|nr:NmrA family transcriptional regulator [Plectosphaerella plurivora]